MPETASSCKAPELSIEQMMANASVIKQTPYGLQDGNGVDVTLIYEALTLPVEQRIRRADAARRSAIWIRQHARRIA